MFGIKLSMSAKGHCYDNAVVESFFHTLKTEEIYLCHYKTRDDSLIVLYSKRKKILSCMFFRC